MKLEKVKTRCCKATWYRKGRANYRCSTCDKDVTLELVLIADLFAEKESKNAT